MKFDGLCVGGPRDGQRCVAPDRYGFIAPVFKPLGPVDFRPGMMPVAETTIEHMQYKLELFHTPTKDFVFWVPERQTPAATMTKLITVYEHEGERYKRILDLERELAALKARGPYGP